MIAVYKLMCSVSDKARGLFKRRVFFSVGQTEKMFVVHFPNGGGKRERVKARCVIKVKDIRMRENVCVCVCVCACVCVCMCLCFFLGIWARGHVLLLRIKEDIP